MAEKLVIILALMVVTWPLFNWLFPYTLRITHDSVFGWSWRLEKKEDKKHG